MFDISDDLRRKLKELNTFLKKRKENWQNREETRAKLQDQGAKFVKLNGFLKVNDLVIAGVDGSVNYYGVYPYRIFFFQAYAATPKGDKIIVSDVKAPFLEDKPDDDPKDRVLPALELEASLKAIDRFKPDIMLFDG